MATLYESIPLTLDGFRARTKRVFEEGKYELLPLLNCYGFLIAGSYLGKSNVWRLPVNERLKRKFRADLDFIADMIFLMRYHANPEQGIEALLTRKFSFVTSEFPKDAEGRKKLAAGEKRKVRILAAARTVYIHWKI